MESSLLWSIECTGICISRELQRVVRRGLLGLAIEGVFSLPLLECCVLAGRLGYVDDRLRGRRRNVGKRRHLILPSIDVDFASMSLVILYPYEMLIWYMYDL